MKKFYLLASTALFAGLTACQDNTGDTPDNGNQPGELPEWYYTGGELGTAFLATSVSSRTERHCSKNLS